MGTKNKVHNKTNQTYMYTYASLVAAEKVFDLKLRYYLSSDEGRKRLENLLDATTINEKDAHRVLVASKTFIQRSRLLGRDTTLLEESEDLILCASYLELTTDKEEYNEQLFNQHVVFTYNMRKYYYPVKKLMVRLPELTLNKILREGYAFREVLGSHYLVRAPYGRVYAVTGTKCDCNEHAELRQCSHSLAVKALIENRRLCRGLQETWCSF